MDIEFIKTAAVTLFVALDPPGLAPIFLGLTSAMSAPQRLVTARRAVLIAFAILACAALFGQALLNMLGISMPAFRIAGGLLLFYIAAEMVFARREQRKTNSAEETVANETPQDIAAFPLAIPLMAGPGAITATILQATAAGDSLVNHMALMLILVVVIGSCYGIFRMAATMNRFMGDTGRAVLERLLGVILAAMAVQIIGDGVMAFH